MSRRFWNRSSCWCVRTLCVLWLAVLPWPLWAQNNGNNGNNNGQGNTNTTNINFTTNGILVDAAGVVRAISPQESQQRLKVLRQQFEQAADALGPELLSPSPLRKLSLVRLEAACQAALEKGEAIPPELQILAGIQRIDMVTVDRENKDIIIAGPAGHFSENSTLPSGKETSSDGENSSSKSATNKPTGKSKSSAKKANLWPRPPLQLDDLVVALRAMRDTGVVGCSIDPREANLARMNQYLKTLGAASSVDVAIQRNYEAAKILGTQDVRIIGVPADTHFAQVLLEADYRMKLMSIGRENPPISRFKSHLAMTAPGSNSSQRFWFVPFYEPFESTADVSFLGFSGQRVQLVTQEEMVTAQGQRVDVKTRLSTTKFAQQFTDRYPELADVVPVYAELQNVVDLAVLASWIHRENISQRIGWKMSLFKDENRFRVAKLNIPKTIETVGNHKLAGGRVIGIFGGGIQIQPALFLPVSGRPSDSGSTQIAPTVEFPANLPTTTWWAD